MIKYVLTVIIRQRYWILNSDWSESVDFLFLNIETLYKCTRYTRYVIVSIVTSCGIRTKRYVLMENKSTSDLYQ